MSLSLPCQLFSEYILICQGLFFFRKILLIFERLREREKRRLEVEEEGGPSDTELSVEPSTGLDLTALRSRSELQPRGRCSTT